MRGMGSLNTNKLFMNFFVVMQYVPRVLRIYLSCKELNSTPNGKTAIWIKGVLNFFMYILASHVSFKLILLYLLEYIYIFSKV